MKHTHASLVLALSLLPALAYGETVKYEYLVEREGIYYKKFTEVPFTGATTEQTQELFKDGKKDGAWVRYYDNGQTYLVMKI